MRGLDVNRVGIVENGIGGGGVSDLGEDHFVPVNPLATDQIEVIRGPATLRYGSQSIGGVVSVDQQPHSRRVPPCRATPASAQRCVDVEMRGASTSVDNGLEGGVLLDAGAGNFAFHADAFGRRADDYRVPRYPYLAPPELRSRRSRRFNGRQPNSRRAPTERRSAAPTSSTAALPASPITQNNALYRIPGIDGEDHSTRIDARQTKVTGKGEYRPQAGGIDAIRFWWGYTDYKHNEIGLADAADPATDGVRQTFTNKEQEGRVEVQLMPFNLRFAAAHHRDRRAGRPQRLTAPGDAPGPLSGLFDPEQQHARRRLHLQRVQVQRDDQGADRRPHRACQAQRHRRRTFPGRFSSRRSGDPLGAATSAI